MDKSHRFTFLLKALVFVLGIAMIGIEQFSSPSIPATAIGIALIMLALFVEAIEANIRLYVKNRTRPKISAINAYADVRYVYDHHVNRAAIPLTLAQDMRWTSGTAIVGAVATRPENTEDACWFAHIAFANNKNARDGVGEAKNALAKIEFLDTKFKQLLPDWPYGRWGETEQPVLSDIISDPHPEREINMAPNGKGHELDVAMRFTGDTQGYAFGDESYRYSRLLNSKYGLDAARIRLVVHLQVNNVAEHFWFDLLPSNDKGEMEIAYIEDKKTMDREKRRAEKDDNLSRDGFLRIHARYERISGAPTSWIGISPEC